MVFDNRIYNEMDDNVENLETDKVPDLNSQIDHIDLEERVIHNVDKRSGEINNVTDMKNVFSNIREEVQKSRQSADLSELYRQAGDLIKLLDTPAFQEKVGGEIGEFRKLAEEEFPIIAGELNKRAREIGSRSHYAEKWGD